MTQLPLLPENRLKNANVIKSIAPAHSHRHAMAKAITVMYVGIRWISRAIIVSPKPYPSLNTSKANRLENIAKRMHRILGDQKITRFVFVFIDFFMESYNS